MNLALSPPQTPPPEKKGGAWVQGYLATLQHHIDLEMRFFAWTHHMHRFLSNIAQHCL